ncbi:MAG: UbiX family flavin prenyltransferase [Syntrophomonas sp.]|uniref:UbiX family flavin prenyltransferase n=1 Tax=Syntrophomonas sp. TaxID=2053627 RepID=UPI00260339F3|nr:flavin prenyltransferase UbiX [Syntrophomonas sp.]MDD2510429.1 UbiX family flavin prenyltransferase [Syntrophomonas sp.]MDD3878460.1 UbiX family flavin prenyltransferase [Syntrophomonas sp.]MDD4625890.1 UbiX family flavin prenyltransferase [Syntrophomonas sp.]
MPKYIVALTGASGMIYAIRLLEELLKKDAEIHLIASDAARIVIEQELAWDCQGSLAAAMQQYLPPGMIYYYDNTDIAAPPASGSFICDSMVVIPCTMASISAIAQGSSRSLLERAADVMLKERRPLLLVPRETPLNSIHLRNMLTLSEMGVSIIPAMPAFYHQPQTIEDMVSFMVGKVLDAMHIPHDLFQRYGGKAER